MALDTAHAFTFYIKPVAGAFTDYTAYVRRNSVSVVDIEGAEIDTLTIELEDYASTLSIVEWSECYLRVDGADYLFYGYVTRVKPRAAKGGQHLIYELRCESSIALLGCNATGVSANLSVTGTWLGITVRALVAAVFAKAGVTGWDLTTYVSVGPTLTSFTVDQEDLITVLNRIALTAGGVAGETVWSWRVETNKVLRMSRVSAHAAPFAIASLATANYTTSFPPSGDPEIEIDASLIINRVTVKGGQNVGTDTTETFNGDGSTLLFAVANLPIQDIVRITVGGTYQTYGVEWYDDAGSYDVLVNYAAGTLRWPVGSAPGVGVANISVTYRYGNRAAYQVTVTNAASFARYGLYFDAEISDRSITSLVQATDLANAILAEYALGRIEGSLEIERYGLRAGQELSITLPLFGVAGVYTIRRVTTAIDKAGTGVKATVVFGGRSQTLSSVLSNVNPSGAYSAPNIPQAAGEIGILRARQRIEFIDPMTDYVEP